MNFFQDIFIDDLDNCSFLNKLNQSKIPQFIYSFQKGSYNNSIQQQHTTTAYNNSIQQQHTTNNIKQWQQKQQQQQNKYGNNGIKQKRIATQRHATKTTTTKTSKP
ncbi:hypothetical protein ACTA71_005466 [Dictyostelium dimigraforme]